MTTTGNSSIGPRQIIRDLAPDVDELRGRRAGFVTRAIAYSIDAFIVIAGVPTILYGIAVVQGLLRLETPTYPPDIPDWVSGTISLLWTFWYFVALWWATGRTVGDVVMGVRVVSRKKQRVGIIAAGVRWWVMVATPGVAHVLEVATRLA
jgi:uncharacterized RDD family membrane protein YckC